MVLYYFILFILGICFGSFSTVLIHRWHSGQGGILLGRSQCPKCTHTLSSTELIPIVSWIFQQGRCKKCNEGIPYFYPIAELFMGLIFVWSSWIAYGFGYFYTDLMWWVFLFWGFITGVYILYDIKYMEIPDQIMVPGIIVTMMLVFMGIFGNGFGVFFDISTYQNFHTFLIDHISASILLYTFFFLQILIPGTIYLIGSHKTKLLPSLLMSFFTFPFDVFRDLLSTKQNKDHSNLDVEIPSWIGGGDLRIALFIGLTLGTLHGITAVALAYIIGSISTFPLLVNKYLLHKSTQREIPFGPFLGLGWMLSLTFYMPIMNYFSGLLL